MNIVFDFGNVLFDWKPSELIRANYPGARHWQIDFDKFAREMADHDDWRAFDAGLVDIKTLAPRIASRMNLDAAELTHFLTELPRCLPPIHETVELVKRLCGATDRRYRVFYLSNMPTEFADVLEQIYPWIAGFDGGIFSGRVGLIKPDPAIFRAAESMLQMEPRETLFLDDVAAIVESAKQCGWHAAQITSPADVLAAVADFGVTLPTQC
ncbi:MAG: HAD family phosphatase [Betaproteobacteria bacterium]|nr:MAG: HAD family phosphatase [Betaproteobacteria bacterium]TAG47567.1 MAG: HAD family phosphatase [Betaproteobacteria bacterium]